MSIEELEDGKEYVCASKGEAFKRIEYTKIDSKRSKRLSNCKFTPQPKIIHPDCVRPRIVTIIRNGLKPRKVSTTKVTSDKKFRNRHPKLIMLCVFICIRFCLIVIEYLLHIFINRNMHLVTRNQIMS